MLQFTSQFALDLAKGLHDLSADSLKLALFDNSASFTVASTTYSTTNEVADGNGYSAGGSALAISSGYPAINGSSADWRFDSVAWTFSLNKSVRWAVAYNSSESDKIIFFVDMGQARTLSALTVSFPTTLGPSLSVRIAT